MARRFGASKLSADTMRLLLVGLRMPRRPLGMDAAHAEPAALCCAPARVSCSSWRQGGRLERFQGVCGLSCRLGSQVDSVIAACRLLDVPFLVAPYEADAQLAFLTRTGRIVRSLSIVRMHSMQVLDVAGTETGNLFDGTCSREAGAFLLFGELEPG